MIVLTIAAANYSVNDLDGDPGFETAVEIIKKYETLHTQHNWPYIGYGHRVLPGEKYTPEKPLKHAQAEALLRKDLKKFIRMFPDHSKDDAILLATLSYNIGPSAVKRSQFYSLIEGDEEILRTSYLRHCKYKGKFHSQLHQRPV